MTLQKTIHLTLLLLVSCASSLLAQTKVTGVVRDENGEPLYGTSVLNKRTGLGEVFIDKTFSIEAVDGDVLQFFFLGYLTQDLTVEDVSKTLNVTMSPEQQTLEDVVVVGYGTQKKVNLTGSVATVQFDEQLANRNMAALSSSLAGLATGLSVIQNSGMAGSEEASLMIRGIGTVNNADPLIVVDDIPDVNINSLNPEDIESITVLKDASAAAIYGSRAANGVILITTKQGVSARPTVRFNFSKSIDTAINPYTFLNDYARAMQLYQQRGDMSKYRDIVDFKDGTIDEWLAMEHIDATSFPSTDWWDIIMRNGSTTKVSASISGGSDKVRVYSSLSYLNKKGLQIYNDYERYNARINLTYDILPRLSFNLKADGSWGKQHYYSETGFGSEILQYAIAGITPYDDETGRYGGAMAYGEDVSIINPLALYSNDISEKQSKKLNAGTSLKWQPLQGLTLQVGAGLIYANDFMKKAAQSVQAFNFQTETDIDYWYIPANEGVYNNTSETVKAQWDLRANYKNKIGKHYIEATTLYSEEYWNKRFQNSYRRDNIHPSLSELDSTLPTYQLTSGYSTKETLRSVVTRLNYNYAGRYLAEFSFRADGSSKFAEGHRWGFFPSASLGWRFSQEPWFKKALGRVISNGKLRFSYGELGNNSGVGVYEQLLTLANMNYVVDGEVVTGFVNRKMTNKDLSWETSQVLNAGIDLGFLRNKLTVEFDFYDRLTKGMIRPSDLSYILSGALDAPRTNIGNLRNRGLEGKVIWKSGLRDFSYKITMNASYNRSRLESWNEYLSKGTRYVGMPWGYTYGYLDSGIAQDWQTVMDATPQSAKPGDVLRIDVNGDGQIDEEDMVAYTQYTNLRPPFDYGLAADFKWKGLDVNILFSGSLGRRDYWINAYNMTAFKEGGYAVSDLQYSELWNNNNTDASMPRMGGARSDTEFYLDNMSFLRLKNLQVGYSFTNPKLKKAAIQMIRIYASGENLFTVTSYRGMDPERIGNKSDVYPQLRSYTFGLSLEF